MGFVMFFSNIGVPAVLVEKPATYVRSILIREGELKSDRSAFAVNLFLEQTARELSSFLVEDHEWLTRLNESGVIRGAYLETESQRIELGEPFEPLPRAEAGFVIHENGLHFIHIDEERKLYLNALVNTNRYSSFIHANMRKPRFVLLYDLVDGDTVLLYGRPWELPDLVYTTLNQSRAADFFLVTNKIIAVKLLGGMGEGNAIVSLYPLLSGRQLIIALALIVIIALSIILLALSIRYRLSGRLSFWKGAAAMGDKVTKKNVVNEIDREISDLFEDETVSEKLAEPVIKKVGTVVETPQPGAVQSEEDETAGDQAYVEAVSDETSGSEQGEGKSEELEKDGIIIKRG
jgi:hypothetical protein